MSRGLSPSPHISRCYPTALPLRPSGAPPTPIRSAAHASGAPDTPIPYAAQQRPSGPLPTPIRCARPTRRPDPSSAMIDVPLVSLWHHQRAIDLAPPHGRPVRSRRRPRCQSQGGCAGGLDARAGSMFARARCAAGLGLRCHRCRATDSPRVPHGRFTARCRAGDSPRVPRGDSPRGRTCRIRRRIRPPPRPG